jgi:23S rRNA pseudouridine1911/1915/1917 synthase
MIIKESVDPGSSFNFTVEVADIEKRLDVYLSDIFLAYSRSYFKRLIDKDLIKVNEKKVKAGYVLREGDKVSVTFPSLPEPKDLPPFDKDLGIKLVAEEPEFIILYKPVGVIVHKPNDYSEEVTLVDWLVSSYPHIKKVGVPERPGIVHRLDKDTSGLLIVPLTVQAHQIFGDLFRDRKIEKTYWAVVKGHPERSGTIDFPIGRDSVNKNRMVHLPKQGKSRDALTQYKVLAFYKDYSLVEVRLITGRTHQIRVHFAALGHPLVGDLLYGEPSRLIDHQALHAKKIAFEYKGEKYSFEYPVPEDMQKLLDQPVLNT